MKVNELIEELKKIDGDLNVYIHGYEGGVSDLESIGAVVDVALNVNGEWWYGKHEVVEIGDNYPGHEVVRGVEL